MKARNKRNAIIVTDTAKDMPVACTGIRPDLFKEGGGVVAQGKMGADGQFVASEVPVRREERLHAAGSQACYRSNRQDG